MIPLLFYSASGFVAFCIFFEFYKGARARQGIRSSSFLVALKDLTLMNKRRYGGFIIHLGVVVAFIGIISSSFFSSEELVTVNRGDDFRVGQYTLKFHELVQRADPEKDVVYARISGYEDREPIGNFFPQKHFHHKGEQPMSEVAIRRTLMDDVYVVLSGYDEDLTQATFHVFLNPMVQWVWIGIGIMVLAGVFLFFPDKKAAPRARVRGRRKRIRSEAA